MTIITKDDFLPRSKSTNAKVVYSTSHTKYWRQVLTHIVHDRVAVASLIFIVVVSLLAIMDPEVGRHSYETTNVLALNLSPNFEHWFGTDSIGRDLWARVWVGARVSLVIGIAGAILPQLIGVIIGSISGYFGGWIDMVIMGIVDIGVCIPSLVYVTLISLWIGAGPIAVVIAISISSWMDSARVVRSRMMQFRSREFVLAAKIQGASSIHLIAKHIFPNILGQIVVSVVSAIPTAIFIEAYLSFIGLGIASPLTSLGQLCKTGVSIYRLYPYQLFIPGAVLSLTILAFYVFGNCLRDALDPHFRDQEIYHA